MATVFEGDGAMEVMPLPLRELLALRFLCHHHDRHGCLGFFRSSSYQAMHSMAHPHPHPHPHHLLHSLLTLTLTLTLTTFFIRST